MGIFDRLKELNPFGKREMFETPPELRDDLPTDMDRFKVRDEPVPNFPGQPQLREQPLQQEQPQMRELPNQQFPKQELPSNMEKDLIAKDYPDDHEFGMGEPAGSPTRLRKEALAKEVKENPVDENTDLHEIKSEHKLELILNKLEVIDTRLKLIEEKIKRRY
jgi:hypothetical protein